MDEWVPNGRPEHLSRACEDSLRRLKVHCIDLYQLHVPDPVVPYKESLGALKMLQDEGKIRHIGVSNVTGDQLSEACDEVAVVSVHNPFNVAYRENEDVLRIGEEKGIAFMPWMPLADRQPAHTDPLVKEMADKHGATFSQVMLAGSNSR